VYWRDITADPNCPAVKAFLSDRLAECFSGTISDAFEFIRSFVDGEDVLDIGVVAHTIERTSDPNWKHGIIKGSANSVIGVDILESPVRALREQGFDVRIMDATSSDDIGERFSCVIIGDVIEHVDNPVSLLKFAKRHLKIDGKILCSTPNPFFVETVVSSFRDGWYIPNADHVRWITPTMALEIAHRADLSLHEFWHLRGRGLSMFRKALIRAIEVVGLEDKECFSSSFYYVFK